ncbi:hypothetical protein C8Q74DRAFT_1449892 [Fomes fomentarius]|nr:hypothetical protein C8Q74DRAFT_1449892 [Fomes fomentarius]
MSSPLSRIYWIHLIEAGIALHLQVYLQHHRHAVLSQALYALRSGITLWRKKHPLVALRDFYETTPVEGQASSAANTQGSVAPELPSTTTDQASPQGIAQEADFPIGQGSASPIHIRQAYAYESLLEKHGIRYTLGHSYPDSAYRVDVRFSSSDALPWARVLSACYITILDTLSDAKEEDAQTSDTLSEAKKGAQTPSDPKERTVRVARRPASKVECLDLYGALALLDDAICGGIVERLLQDELVRQLNAEYMESMNNKTKPRLAQAINQARSGDSVDLDCQYDVDDALIIPFRAAINIVYSCFNAPPDISLTAYQVIVTPVPLAITTSYLDCFKAKFAKLYDVESTIVNQVLGELQPGIVNGTTSVHAEAALMSLVSAASEVANVITDTIHVLTPA